MCPCISCEYRVLRKNEKEIKSRAGSRRRAGRVLWGCRNECLPVCCVVGSPVHCVVDSPVHHVVDGLQCDTCTVDRTTRPCCGVLRVLCEMRKVCICTGRHGATRTGVGYGL